MRHLHRNFGYGYAIANIRTVPRTGPGGKPRRVYRSAQRTAQARDTRQRIVAAATEHFARAGYPATTMRSIAAAAGVSVASIELAFGSKAQLLKTAIDVAIAGDHDPVAVLDRGWATAAQASTTLHDFLTAVARTLPPAMTRSASLVLAAYGAGETDPALRELAGQLSAQRATTVAWIIDGIRDRATLRKGLTRRHAIDQVWLLMDPAVYQRLTRYRGWSPTGYEQWFTDTITRLLLD
jgi:TetR/AcrR family transcriptional regulator, regulator of autoinduction and epiphytic fitness